MNDNDDFKLDLSKYADSLDRDKIAGLWAKAEVATIMMDQARNLLRQVYADIEFYHIAHEYKKDNNA
jgi:hypothetical protein